MGVTSWPRRLRYRAKGLGGYLPVDVDVMARALAKSWQNGLSAWYNDLKWDDRGRRAVFPLHNSKPAQLISQRTSPLRIPKPSGPRISSTTPNAPSSPASLSATRTAQCPKPSISAENVPFAGSTEKVELGADLRRDYPRRPLLFVPCGCPRVHGIG